MKKYIYILIFLMGSFNLFAQNDTILNENFDELTPASGIQIPVGWTNINANNDLVKWDAVGNGNGLSLPNAIWIMTGLSFTEPTNDWLITTPIILKAGRVYETSFWYRRSANYVSVEKLKVKWGKGTDTTSMTNLLMMNEEVSNSEFEQSLEYIYPMVDDTIYLGFHCFSAPDQFALIIDDVSVVELSNQKEVASFVIPNQIGSSIIDTANAVINILMPSGTNITNLTPQVEVSEFASVSPLNGETLNFTDSVDYVVTAADMSYKIWKVVVTVEQGFQNTNKIEELVIFPNPARNMLNISSAKDLNGATINIFNSLGQKVIEFKASNDFNNMINISTLPKGVYQLTINNHFDYYFSKQFMVQ